jgi:Pvc16 N-terminal domain
MKWILSNALGSSGLDSVLGMTPLVSTLPPDRIHVGSDEQAQLNLFMYHVSQNASWRNVDLPSTDPQGRRISNPPLALNLHYFISAYGKNEFDAEILLGWAMQILHETPVLSKDLVQSSLAAMATSTGATSEMKAIANTTLADQVELAKITPEIVSTEDLSKLWTAFQANYYRTTAAYQVSVLLIRATHPVRSNLPVQSRNIAVQLWQPPLIDNLVPSLVGAGETLTIQGRNFIGDAIGDTKLSFDGGAPVAPDLAQDKVLKAKVPALLPAGIRTVQVARSVRFGAPTDPHRGFVSNPATFMLVPALQAPIPTAVKAGTNLTLTVSPPVGRSQRAAVLIGDQAVEIDARPPTAPATSTTLTFPIPADFPVATPPVALPLRLRIDGAQSRITQDTNSASPTYLQWLPQLQVTGP